MATGAGAAAGGEGAAGGASGAHGAGADSAQGPAGDGSGIVIFCGGALTWISPPPPRTSTAGGGGFADGHDGAGAAASGPHRAAGDSQGCGPPGKQQVLWVHGP